MTGDLLKKTQMRLSVSESSSFTVLVLSNMALLQIFSYVKKDLGKLSEKPKTSHNVILPFCV